MNDPRRLRDETPEGFAPLTALVRRVDPPEPRFGEGERLLAQAEAHVRAKQLRSRQIGAFVACAVASSLAVWVVFPRHVAAPFTLEPGASLSASNSEAPPRVLSGRVHATPSATLARLDTPHASIQWLNARFLLDVDARSSQLFVEAGEVIWRADGVERHLFAGARAKAPAPVSVPAAFEDVRLSPSPDCPASALDGRIECLEHLAANDSLKGQNALFEWALLQREVRHRSDEAARGWRAYLTRFPDGALAPEASLGLVTDLLRQERYVEALDAVHQHQHRFPTLFPTELKAIEARVAERVAQEQQ